MTAGEVTFSLGAIRVGDLDRSLDFYTGGCGFVLEKRFTTPAFEAAIVRAGVAGVELIVPHGESATERPDHGNMLQKFVLNTPDPAAVMRRACEFGGSEVSPATEYPAYGMTIGVLADPDGYLLELVGRTADPADPR